MTSHQLPPPLYYDLPAYDDVVIANRLQQVESRLQKYIADVLKHNDVAVSEKAQQMVSNILLIYEKRFDDLGGDVRQKMDAFKDWASRLGTGEQTLIEMDKKLAKIHDKVAELDAFHALIKRHEEREKEIHSDLLRRIKALEEREEKNHDVLIDEGVMRHIEKMVETRMRGWGADAGIDIDIDALFDDSKLTPEEIEEIKLKQELYKLDFMSRTIREHVMYPSLHDREELFEYIKKCDETIIYFDKINQCILITDKNIYFFNSIFHMHRNGKNEFWVGWCNVYTFNKKLTYSLIKFLQSNYNMAMGIEPHNARGEILHKLIPGTFPNGEWIAIDDIIFGRYINKITSELGGSPPMGSPPMFHLVLRQ